MASTTVVKDTPELDSPAGRAAAVSPSDSSDLTSASRALYVGGAGDVVLMTVGDDTVTFVAVPAGSILPMRVKRVLSTGTTATSILALW
jgi:hypothetical protein